MAATLPSEPIQVPLTPWSFSSNPGPFNLKEHVLITIFTSCGSGGVFAVGTYIWWAGLFRKYLVDSTYIWWPSNLVQVKLFRNLFPSISALSFVCWIWKDSVTEQKLVLAFEALAPPANVAFKTYGYISMHKALGFLEDFKLGHYMKIQPKSMFIVQLAGPIDLLITSATQVCCRLGVPGHVLVMMFSTMLQLSGELRFQCWWARHTYILSAALDAGVALMGVILYFTLQCHDTLVPHWWDLAATDNGPLARCPTARGIKVRMPRGLRWSRNSLSQTITMFSVQEIWKEPRLRLSMDEE
ncbi:Oligopeptide transporter 1 [Citrus sinensis]|nr:Oligopeptide transporter 1 [Citrus sinensis]